MFSQIFTLLGAGCSAVCVLAKAPELLMLGRVLVGINSGQFSLNPFRRSGSYIVQHEVIRSWYMPVLGRCGLMRLGGPSSLRYDTINLHAPIS